MKQPGFAVLDVETTGLDASRHRIVEIAIVTTDAYGRVSDEWSTRINPQGPVGATHIHGITDDDVRHAPPFADLIGELNRRLAGSAVAAHHARFDLAFLRAEYSRAGWRLPLLPALCTLQASEHHLPHLDRRRLSDCCWAVGHHVVGAHSAIGDARATASLLAAFMHPSFGTPPLPQHADLPRQGLAVRWPTGPSSEPPVTVVPARVRAAWQAQGPVSQPAALVELVDRFSLGDALDEGAPEGAVAYLEKLAEVLEDGELTAQESADLAAVAATEDLTDGQVADANRAFVLALAHEALNDGKVTRAERAELHAVAALLAVQDSVVSKALDAAEQARHERLSMGLRDLPPGWAHGKPLQVGDKVVFTGCDDDERARLEARSEKVGVRVVSSVSARTAMLVTDGSVDGIKAAKAREIGTRTVDPALYTVLLKHLQPAARRSPTTDAQSPAAPLTAGEGSLIVPTMTSAPDRARVDPSVVRAWARSQGLEVGVRGRLSKDVFAAYDAAQATAPAP
ncbi:histone-like nucleoid-structuring protein Lsr2 [Oryzobacter sp. R7]|uniref:exonuclease domain-containing protein n=1 Tax=Oryzobacter faecalis TaxID=3388656 RepID=UPI00398CA3BD